MAERTSDEHRDSVIYDSVEQLRSPTVKELDTYWCSKRRGRAMPPVRVRYRLVGTLQVNTTGCVGIDDFVPFETQLGKRR